MSKTNIEWADMTINPVVGCSPKSNGCKHCYAKRMWARQHGMKKSPQIYKNMKNFGDVAWNTKILLDALQKLKKPQNIFLCSMSDLFHVKVPDEVIRNIMAMCGQFPQHTFMILTKRYKRLDRFMRSTVTPVNVMFGISICDKKDLIELGNLNFSEKRIFISFEPLLETFTVIDLLEQVNVSWVIVGGETGPGHRPFEESWGLRILSESRRTGIPFFFKQRYLNNGSKTDILGGCNFHEFPKELRL